MQLLRNTSQPPTNTPHLRCTHTEVYMHDPRARTDNNQHTHGQHSELELRPLLLLGPMTKTRKKDGLVGNMPAAFTIVLQRPRCSIVKNLIHMIQYELNHHLLDSDSQESCISIATSGLDLFGPESRKEKVQLSESALQPEAGRGSQWAFCTSLISSMYMVC